MFDAARKGDAELLVAAVEAGLPVNLTNDKGFSIAVGPEPLTTTIYREHSHDAGGIRWPCSAYK
jgi:hypothetical protein